MDVPCESELIRDETQDFGKWGWVFYRCTYDDDDAWARFRGIINDTSRKHSEFYEYPEILDKMKWTFLEDKQQFDGASTAKLRAHFREWVKQSAPPRDSSETPPREPNPPGLESSSDNTMYDEYFAQVDEISLRSVVYKELPPAEANLYIRRHINLVSTDWKPARLEDYHGDNVIEDHFSFPELEGCTEENVGWMSLAVSEVGPSTFQRIPHLWYIIYERLPDIVYRV